MSSGYARIFDNDGVPFWDGPRASKSHTPRWGLDIVMDDDGTPRYTGGPDDILNWYLGIGKDLKPGPFKVLVDRIKLERYLSLDEYFEYFEFPSGLDMALTSQVSHAL